MCGRVPKFWAADSPLLRARQGASGPGAMVPAPPLPPFAAIIVAGGEGLRAGQSVPKQFAQWRGKPVLRHSVEALRAYGASLIVVAIPQGADAIAESAIGDLERVHLVTGGATRQESVRKALEALASDAPALVLVHDAARPVVPFEVVARLLAALDEAAGAIAVLPVVDSIAVAAGERMADHADRSALRRVQTPQAFRFADILAAHRAWDGTLDAGDDAQVLHRQRGDIALVAGDERLAKLTYATDFQAPAPAPAPTVKVGFGYDVHRLAAGEELWLGGVLIAHDKGLAGHSDADVALHALVDAILGAIGDGDIGTHFPPSDPRWRGAASARFVEHAMSLARAAGWDLAHSDVTLICEAPKIGPHRAAIRARIAELLAVSSDEVSVKATTTEGLGFAGRREGIAAQAVVTLTRSQE